jgi:aspartate beta-hydroxylase
VTPVTLEQARSALAEGRIEDAARAYRAVRPQAPAEAAQFLGVLALRTGRAAEAVAELEAASRALPGDLVTLENLGLAYESAGEAGKAVATLRAVLAREPQFFVSRLALGFAEHRLGHRDAALAHWQWALRQARKRRAWLNDESIPPWLLERVTTAARLVRQHREQVLIDALEAARPAGANLERVEAFVRIQSLRERGQSSDPRQKPKTHLMPGLPPSPWFDLTLFPWTQRLVESFPVILEEYLAVAGDGGAFPSFLEFKNPEQVARHLGTSGPAPEWNAFFFYRHGERNDANCARCPRTAALLEELPLIRLPGAAPEICFSVLTAGSHILPHHGDSNLRSVVHLGLVVPDDCALNVAGEARTWQPGAVLAFDDTYEHEAWNRSGRSRAVLLMDAWNPHLTDAEKAVLPPVIAALRKLGEDLQPYKPEVL